MKIFDSLNCTIKHLFSFTLIVALSGCSQTTTSGYSPDLALAAPLVHEGEASKTTNIVGHFQDLCLRPTLNPVEGKTLALRLGWQEVDEVALEQAGLAALRKRVLEIPGGGARFREEQEIVGRQLDAPEEQSIDVSTMIAAFERRIAGNETRSVSCALYFRSDFLQTCEALGRLINRAPDRNQAYPQRNAHFIQWTIRLDGKEAILSCSRTPQSALLPYDGTTLSVSADHSGTAQKTAFRTIRTGGAKFGASDR